ncbi:MAG TPA: phosphoenolpyruvate carboxykinase (ATP), partial [Polyangia bacterium]|nr:phosphoenolpyruvate carboxykinase (ATP) [Polyangia bacterium]
MDGELQKQLEEVLGRYPDVKVNPDRKTMIADVVARREAMVAACGCLAMWTPPESTGRSPQDTVTVRRPESEKNI